jgi:hypothetical protein
MRAHRHRVDRGLRAFRGDHHCHLQQIASMIGTDDKPAVGILAGVFECERMICRVEDVCISDTVFARRAANFRLLM